MRSDLASADSKTSGSVRRRVLAAVTGFAAVVAGLVALPASAGAFPNHNPQGAIDKLTFSDGWIRVGGWAIDPETGSPILVDIRANGTFLTTVKANQYRADIGAKYPAYGPYHGFSASFTRPNGTYKVCAVGHNIGAGQTTAFACSTITVNNNPVGRIDSVQIAPGGLRVRGWAIDPNTHNSVKVRILDNGVAASTVTADRTRTDLPSTWSPYGQLHGFDVTIPVADGAHSVCVDALNVGYGDAATRFPCVSITRSSSPFGAIIFAHRESTTSTNILVSGWAIDPNTASPIKVMVFRDSAITPAATVTANVARGSIATKYPNYGANHEFDTKITADGGEHQICVTAVNVGAGTNSRIGCTTVLSTGDTTPAPVPNVQAWPGNTTVDVTWTPPRSVRSPISKYTVQVQPSGKVLTVSGSTTKAHVTGLTNGTDYRFTVFATNSFGNGSSTSVVARPSIIPPQFTPAPVSTSHYPRNWTGNLTNDAAMLRKMGAVDASYNPSNHRYLILQDIGGQDTGRGGVLLSATSKFFTYDYLVAMMKAYIDGYHSTQKPYAPLTLAIGTNNDVDVSSAAGAAWANKVIDPLVSYASRYPDISIAGANDIEPGFSATVAESRAWVSGYLANTSAKYVFNGSADGCSTTTAGSHCNNGWTMGDLYWVGGGAAPSRTINLPQIYNTAMPLQWKNISLTGVQAGKQKLYFGGPLTEWTACDQAGSCYSMPNVNAWSALWKAISSSSATKQYDMPFGTDLKIN